MRAGHGLRTEYGVLFEDDAHVLGPHSLKVAKIVLANQDGIRPVRLVQRVVTDWKIAPGA